MPKAIVIVGPGNVGMAAQTETPVPSRTKQHSLVSLEIMGASIISRLVEDLKRAGMESVAIVSDCAVRVGNVSRLRGSSDDGWMCVTQELISHANDGTDSTLIVRLGPYVEFDISEALQLHTESGEAVLRAFEEDDPLDIWVLDPKRMVGPELKDGTMLAAVTSDQVVRYQANGYVNCLENARDLRNLVVDGLNSRCRLRPLGFEVRPGVWMAEGAEVEKEARIVAPAYIGRETIISQQCLITRGSSIERNSVIDYGTVIEDTSVLPNSYVGIGLDVSHSIVDGDKLLNLQHGVVVTIEDSAVMRQNKPLGEAECRWWNRFEKREPILSAAEESAK